MKLTRVRLSGLELKLALIFLLSLFSLSIFIFGRSTAAPSYNQSKHAADSIEVIPTKPMQIQNTDSSTAGSDNISKITGIALPPAHQGLASSTIPQLQKLAQYEQSAGGAVASGMMYFTRYSDNTSSTRADAADMSATLKEFAKNGLTPLIIMEPTNSSGSLNFSSYRNGAYDSILDTYFQTLKSLGVTDSELGIWTYFPEANLPEWGPVDTADFSPNVVRSVNIQKKYFPASRATIMLDAESYPAGSTNWGNGSYTSLKPFISGIPAGLLDSVGLQGFPWAPPANTTGEAPSYNPAVYLNASLAAEAANYLGVHDIWFNTGTFAATYINNPAQTVRLTASQRQTMLDGVLMQALNAKNAGFNVAVNLFCQDKSNTSLAVDRSYKTPDDQAVFNNFAGQLSNNHITMWLFDD